MKLAIIDLDGVVADATARFAKAEDVKQQWIEDQRISNNVGATDIYWRAVFNPENVSLDTLIEGVNEALLDIQQQGFKIVFLTSRPESMRDATVQWLFEQTVYDADDELVMKSPAFQFTKTVVWKAGTIQMFVALYDADDVLVVDDEPVNLAELAKYDTSHMRLCASLAEAIGPELEVSEDHPF